jgi:Carboxypeptidase regulatory-like domain
LPLLESMRSLLAAVTVAILITSLACSDGPSQSSGPTTPTTLSLLSIGCGQDVDGYQCSLRADSNGVSRDVTGFATWSTSDTNIATVNSVGFVTVLQDGQVAIRASYQGESTFLIMQVQAGGLRRYYRALSGWVVDAETETKLAGVSVAFVAGVNVGRTTQTGTDGAYQIYDLQPGTFTVRFSKAGYRSADYPFTLPGDRLVSLDARLTRSP